MKSDDITRASQSVVPETSLELPNGLELMLLSPQQRACARFIVKEVFQNQAYLRPGFEIRPADTVLDIGANMGIFALWAAPQAPQGRLICIEPTRVVECLERSVARNNIVNTVIEKCAISDQAGSLELIEYAGFTAVSHSAAFQPARWGQFFINLLWRKQQTPPTIITCPCRTLESVLDEHGIEKVDLLKVDCEGGEYAIFDTISEATLARISRIAMEFHELHSSHDHRKLVNRLRSAGFHVDVERPLFQRLLLKTGMIWAKRKS